MAVALKQTPNGMFNDLALISRTENNNRKDNRNRIQKKKKFYGQIVNTVYLQPSLESKKSMNFLKTKTIQ